jgi:hypothetical protein
MWKIPKLRHRQTLQAQLAARQKVLVLLPALQVAAAVPRAAPMEEAQVELAVQDLPTAVALQAALVQVVRAKAAQAEAVLAAVHPVAEVGIRGLQAMEACKMLS